MALDGAFLCRIKQEIENVALGARVDKIAQPSREEILLHLRWRGDGGKLLLSAGAGNARIHFTRNAPENPKSPPMFCMLLRKHLSGAKLVAVRQLGLDRILFLVFSTTNELGDEITLTMAAEIMGRHSNIVLVGPDNRVIDAIKRIDFGMSSVRQILPGLTYALPPVQDKLNLREATVDQVLERLESGRDVDLSKALMEALQGMSPLLCREIAHVAADGLDLRYHELKNRHRQQLRDYLEQLQGILEGTVPQGPTMLLEGEGGRPREFSFLPIRQYGTAMETRDYPDCCRLLDGFYTERDRVERVRQRSGDLLKLLANISDRLHRKLAAQREELKECALREELKIKGDLISSNIYAIQKGEPQVRLENFYSQEGGEMEIQLDPLLSPAQNAQRYYALYRKADTAERMLKKLIAQGEEELRYIDSVFDLLTRAAGEGDLEAIREELVQGGYARRQNRGGKQKRQEKLPPIRYTSSDGFAILVGRNNVQNDQLTLKQSSGKDLWFHTQKIPGSHTIVVTDGKDVPKSTIEQACIVAAYHSKARESTKVPVDFTQVRYVKKPGGAKPGMVIYDKYETVIVNPDEELVQGLEH